MAKLVIYEEEETEGTETVFEEFELITPRILMGSGPDNELVLEAPDVDSIHASLELRDEHHWILQDLGGPHTTVVNGQAIDGPYHLNHDDLIELGSVKIKFHDIELETVADEDKKEAAAEAESHPRGRTWFAGVAGITLAIIFIILFLLIVADYLGLIEFMDLIPPWI